MRQDIYELVALGMRYVFVLLGVVILLRALRWALQDHRAYRRTLAALPDAGLMGEIVNIETGESQPLPREGVIGSGRGCDVRLHGLRTREVEFILREGTGVHVMPCHVRHQAVLDGQPLSRQRSWALHGSRLSLPGYYLRFRLFAGLDVPSAKPADMDIPAHQPQDMDDESFDMESLAAIDGIEGVPLEQPCLQQAHFFDDAASDVPSQPQDLEMTWMYAIPPAGDIAPPTEMPVEPEPVSHGSVFRRRRRSSRHEEK